MSNLPFHPAEVAKTIELSFPSMPEYLGVLRAALRGFCEKVGFSEEATTQVTLAAVEAATNIIRHAYKGDPHQRVVVFCRETAGGIEVEFLDWGESIPGDKVPALASQGSQQKALQASPGPGGLQPGGLGVQIIKTCMDQVQYKLIRSGGNRLVLTKMREEPGAEKSPGAAAPKKCKEKGKIS